MNETAKNIIIAVIAAVLVVSGYFIFFRKGNQADESILSVENPKSGAGVVDKDLVSLLLELKSIDLNESLFLSSVFQGLSDFGIEIEQKPVGRKNPFAPTGNEPKEEIKTQTP